MTTPQPPLLHRSGVRILAILAVAPLIALSACGAPSPNVETDRSPVVATDGTLYEDPDGRFTLRVAEPWTTPDNSSASFRLWRFSATDNPGQRLSVAVWEEVALANAFTNEQDAVRIMKESARFGGTDGVVRIIELADGRRAYEALYTTEAGARSQRIASITVRGETHTMNAVFGTTPDIFDTTYSTVRPYLLTLTPS